jgi:hypothetical protein
MLGRDLNCMFLKNLYGVLESFATVTGQDAADLNSILGTFKSPENSLRGS